MIGIPGTKMWLHQEVFLVKYGKVTRSNELLLLRLRRANFQRTVVVLKWLTERYNLSNSRQTPIPYRYKF